MKNRKETGIDYVSIVFSDKGKKKGELGTQSVV